MGRIFSACINLENASCGLDIVSLEEELNSKGRLKRHKDFQTASMAAKDGLSGRHILSLMRRIPDF
ncbi:hypothetical protein [Neisseria elongata]|uniref:hypothetical protein n=1 Tax=Neisseria elongata TaxID=495 RepID=UPI00351A321A